jgi:hypothetical protein
MGIQAAVVLDSVALGVALILAAGVPHPSSACGYYALGAICESIARRMSGFCGVTPARFPQIFDAGHGAEPASHSGQVT